MPEINGLNSAKGIRQIRPKRPEIIAITAFAMQGTWRGGREMCVEPGTDGYLSKPVNPGELSAA